MRAGHADLFKPDPALPDESVTTDTILDQLVIAGTSSQVVEELLAFRDVVGDFGTLLYCGLDWVDPRIARRSMELMAERVMPEINRAIGGTAFSLLPHADPIPERPAPVGTESAAGGLRTGPPAASDPLSAGRQRVSTLTTATTCRRRP